MPSPLILKRKAKSLHTIIDYKVVVCILISAGISHVYWWKIRHKSHESHTILQIYKKPAPCVKYIFTSGHPPQYFCEKSINTPKIELVDHVAVAVVVGVGFDVILWYFIWLCWFDCARSSILRDVSDILQKYFALLAFWSTH